MNTLTPEAVIEFSRTARTGDISAMRHLVARHGRIHAGALVSGALVSAADAERVGMLEFLATEHRDQITEKSALGAMFKVIEHKTEQIALALIGQKLVDLDKPICFDGATPLIRASLLGLTNIVAALLKHGASVNKQSCPITAKVMGSYLGTSPLMAAASQNRVEIARLLLDAGADVNAIGEGGKTALDFTGTSAKRAAVRELLLKAGAKSGKELRAVAQSATTKPAAKKPSAPVAVRTMDDACRLLEERCGTSAKPHPEIKAAFFFHLKQDASGDPKAGKPFIRKLESLRAELVPLVAPAGLMVVRTHHLKMGLGLCLLAAKHKFDAVEQFGFCGRKWGISPAKTLAFLKKLDKVEPFELVECGRDALGGKFAAGTKQAAKLAKELEAFCPFVCEDHDDDPKVLAKHLAKGGEFVLWWD